MPTYIYRCANGHEVEKFEPMTASPVQKCPECPAEPVCHCYDECENCGQCTCPDYTMTRQIGAGAGFTFKGGAPTRKFHRRG